MVTPHVVANADEADMLTEEYTTKVKGLTEEDRGKRETNRERDKVDQADIHIHVTPEDSKIEEEQKQAAEQEKVRQAEEVKKQAAEQEKIRQAEETKKQAEEQAKIKQAEEAKKQAAEQEKIRQAEETKKQAESRQRSSRLKR